jgi:hypothetical protein
MFFFLPGMAGIKNQKSQIISRGPAEDLTAHNGTRMALMLQIQWGCKSFSLCPITEIVQHPLE